MPLNALDLGDLYDRHAGALLGFFARRTLDPEAAADLLAETFAAAFEDRAQFRSEGGTSASAWLFGIARHRLSDFYRHGRVERQALQRLGVDRRALTEPEYDRIEELATSDALRAAVSDALGQLGERDRVILRLRVVEERPYHEVAAMLGISAQTARARTSRALRALRSSMQLGSAMEVLDHA